ncbi:hypothetical protein DMENIID0001_098540 [Sergentomyia squamirostris]
MPQGDWKRIEKLLSHQLLPPIAILCRFCTVKKRKIRGQKICPIRCDSADEIFNIHIRGSLTAPTILLHLIVIVYHPVPDRPDFHRQSFFRNFPADVADVADVEDFDSELAFAHLMPDDFLFSSLLALVGSTFLAFYPQVPSLHTCSQVWFVMVVSLLLNAVKQLIL